VTKSADVHAQVRKAVAQYGGLDFAFNNAGLVGSVAGIVETTEEDWSRVVATNLRGVWLCIKYEIPEMLNGTLTISTHRPSEEPMPETGKEGSLTNECPGV
jgi:NAD(P)-dependent dehydrogenase (short-subunit alcohol dehydrogenase family)